MTNQSDAKSKRVRLFTHQGMSDQIELSKLFVAAIGQRRELVGLAPDSARDWMKLVRILSNGTFSLTESYRDNLVGIAKDHTAAVVSPFVVNGFSDLSDIRLFIEQGLDAEVVAALRSGDRG
jgi:hypothetical protein